MIAWGAILPTLIKGAKIAGTAGSVAEAMKQKGGANNEQMVHNAYPQLPTLSMPPTPSQPLHQGNYEMHPLMQPSNTMQPLAVTPEYDWSQVLGQKLGKGKQWMKQHPLLTAGLTAGAMGLATRGNPDAMLLGGLAGNALARRIPTIGGQ